MLSVVWAEVRDREPVHEDGPILNSRPAKTCNAWAAPPTKYQLYFPKATLEAVSGQNCSTVLG